MPMTVSQAVNGRSPCFRETWPRFCCLAFAATSLRASETPMNRRPSSTPQTFDIANSCDMLAKLERELERVTQTDDRDDLVDHTFNFAITAWHMTDWLWTEFEGKPYLKARIAKAASMPPARFGLNDFKAFICGPRGSTAIDHCRIIATSSKHADVAIVHQARLSPRVMPMQPREFRITHGLQLDGTPIVHIRARWVPEITIGSETTAAIGVFEEALRFWKNFITRYGSDDTSKT